MNSTDFVEQMSAIEDPRVKTKFESYPQHVLPKLLALRELILEVASATSGVGVLEESLKWGEPSYTAKGGSPVRIDWKPKSPEQYAVYFNCQTKLVETFRAIYGDVFSFEGNRAIVLDLQEEIAADELGHCVSLCLKYHRIKHLPMLGAGT